MLVLPYVICKVLFWWDPFCVRRPKHCLCVCYFVLVVPFVGCYFAMIGFVPCARFFLLLLPHGFVVPFLLLFVMFAWVGCARGFVCYLYDVVLVGSILCS